MIKIGDLVRLKTDIGQTNEYRSRITVRAGSLGIVTGQDKREIHKGMCDMIWVFHFSTGKIRLFNYSLYRLIENISSPDVQNDWRCGIIYHEAKEI